MHGQGIPIAVESYGGLVTLARPDNLPTGASPRTYDTDFEVGCVRTRAGLTSVVTAVDAEVGPNPPASAVSSTWLNPTNITAEDGSFTSFAPVIDANSLDIGTFAFSIPPQDSISGVLVSLSGYSNAPAAISVQLLASGVPVGTAKTYDLSQATESFTLGGLSDGWGAGLTSAQVNGTGFGLRIMAVSTGFTGATVLLDYANVSVGVSTSQSNFQFVTTFTAQDGTVKNIYLDAAGNLWVEQVNVNPGVLELVRTDITPNSYCVGVNGPDVEYLAFSDGKSGSDMPLQYTSRWTDRITQVGPGAAPSFQASTASTATYDITSITQPVPRSWGFAYFLRSQGPGSTTPGNNITFYYADSTLTGADADLVAAFNSGNPVYMYVSFVGPVTYGPYVVQVTSIGLASPPFQGRAFYYFTFTDPESVTLYTYFQGSGHPAYTANYQRSLATMSTAVPVPGLAVGNAAQVTGVTPSAWNSTWTITQTLNSGSVAITQTEVTAGTATYNYAVVSGTPPAAGQLITISGTTNANGALNGANKTIATSTGGSTGSFTIGTSSPNYTAAPESGAGTTAGTQFAFDPGALLVGTNTSPIYGNGTGGELVFNSNGQFVGTGTRQGTVFFITRNGCYTAPAPPVIFTCPENTVSIQVTNIPIGPPNVIARAITITEPGQNGVPGANFFTIPDPVEYTVNNLPFTADSLIIRDNTTSSATFFFTDNVLLNALAIDVYGYNLFNNIEIGDPAWIVKYNDRNFYGLCVNKVQKFDNLSFDGGFLLGQTYPLGWTQPDAYGSLVTSPRFGNSYYISNTSGDALPVAGLISQTAYQDSYKTPILDVNTTYSVRVTCSNPSAITGGSLVISLTNGGVTIGSFDLPLSSMSTDLNIYSGTLLATPFSTVPAGLTLNVYGSQLADGADILIDRFDVFPTEIPVLTTTVYGSYAGLYENVDAVTGKVGFSSENQQPINGAVVMYDTFYGMKAWAGKNPGASMYSLQAQDTLEPAQWQEPEVAQKAGAIGVNAFDFGEQWIVMANRNGLYLFEGGQPGKIMQEIYQVWDAINWSAAQSIWVRNDVVNRKLYVGVPMATPNFWLPNAPVNTSPTSPNVILVCSYKGLDTGAELKSEPQMHTTMFGNLNVMDMRRKWTIWQVASPYAAICAGSQDEQFLICNGSGNSKVYRLDDDAATDDGAAIDSVYTTSGLPDSSDRAKMPALGLNRVRNGYMTANLSSGGTVNVTLYPNVLLGPDDDTSGYNAWTIPGGFTPGLQPRNDIESSLNFVATRTFFEFRQNDGQKGFNLSTFATRAKKDTWNADRGAK